MRRASVSSSSTSFLSGSTRQLPSPVQATRLREENYLTTDRVRYKGKRQFSVKVQLRELFATNAHRVCLCLSYVIEYGNRSELSCRRSHLRIFGRETTIKFLSPALNNCERFSSSSGRTVVVVVVVVEVALVVVVLVVCVVVVVLFFVRNYLNLDCFLR